MNTPNGKALDCLIARGARGDMQAFAALVRETESCAFALAVRMLDDADDAEDAVQECFLRVWRHLGRYDGRAKFTTWLYTIVSRICLDRLRERARTGAVTTRLPEGCEAVGTVESAEARIETRDLAEAVRAMARELPPVQRLVFTLRDLEDLPVREVCDITGLSEGSVKTNLCYARRALRARLEKHESIRR